MIYKHRGIVMGKKGIVASAHPNISQSGIKILEAGGNAMDAAIAMANTSGVVHPDMAGLGGDAFVLYFDAKSKEITSINGSGCAPKKATREYFISNEFSSIPNDGMLSVTVPGAVDAYFTALKHFGTMEFKDLIEDAINLCEQGIVVSEKLQRHMRTDLTRLNNYIEIKKQYTNNGKPYEVGDIIYNQDYADSLKLIAKEGPDAFYKGTLAQKIIDHSRKNGGLLEFEDLKDYKSKVLKPIKVEYRDYNIYQTPPVSQGIIHLEQMNILNNFNLSQYKVLSADAIHLMVEAKKISFLDRNKYFGDPKYIDNPLLEILSPKYGKEMADTIFMDKSIDVSEDTLGHDRGHTASFVVVDKEGNAASFIHSISNTWGSCELVKGTGIILNNRAGTGFNLHKDHPNCINGNNKTMSTLNTYIVTNKDGTLKYVGNTPGGDDQPQVNMQVLVNLIDFKLDVQEAVEAPKWINTLSSNPYGRQEADIIKIESTIGQDVIKQLEKKGHTVEVLKPLAGSGASQVIEVKSNGVKFAGSDPRSEGCALGEI